jgi:hypothetical protein
MCYLLSNHLPNYMKSTGPLELVSKWRMATLPARKPRTILSEHHVGIQARIVLMLTCTCMLDKNTPSVATGDRTETSLVATMVRHVERKALQIHNLISRAQKISSTAYAVVTLHGGICRPPVWKVGNPLSPVHSGPRIYF